jgi:hypothetical protein
MIGATFYPEGLKRKYHFEDPAQVGFLRCLLQKLAVRVWDELNRLGIPRSAELL